MTPEQCLFKIMDDAGKFDELKLEVLSKKKREIELDKVMKRWLGWISSVNNTPKWDTGCDYDDGEEFRDCEENE